LRQIPISFLICAPNCSGVPPAGSDAVVLQLLAGFLELERLGHFGVDAVHDRPRQEPRADEPCQRITS